MPLIDNGLPPETQDAALKQVADFLYSTQNFSELIGKGLRQAFDEVIDGPRTGRFKIEQLEKTEKTYIGTKIEIVLRNRLSLSRGEFLDNSICNHEVDTKFSLTGAWMIPREAIGHLCLLVQGNDNSGTFSVGLLRTTLDNLTEGSNQDGKKSISAYGKKRITWIVLNDDLPRNFLLDLSPDIREKIMSHPSGVQRMKSLFTNVTNQIIPRTAIEQVAQQKDSLKRAREMKKILADEGFQVICAAYDRNKFIDNGFTNFKDDDWLSIKI